jgi:hypothetical protein
MNMYNIYIHVMIALGLIYIYMFKSYLFMCQGIAYSFDGKDVFNIVISIINHSSTDWFKGKFTGNHCFHH